MKLKKVFSLALCLVILFSSFVFASAENGSAENGLPESEHNYADGISQSWSCAVENAPYGVFVSFSEETSFEPISIDKDGDIKNGDDLYFLTETDDLIFWSSGDGLAGVELYIPYSSFKMSLVTDESVNGYGFKVTNMRAAERDEVHPVTFHPRIEGESDVTTWFSKERPKNYLTDNYSVIPVVTLDDNYFLWSETPDGTVAELSGWPSPDTDDVWGTAIELSLKSDEIFSFSNSRDYFSIDGKRNYYMSKEDYLMLHRNLYRSLSAMPLAAVVLSAALVEYPHRKYRGACYGISAVTALQHEGIIDILPMQNAKSMREMKPDKELISLINYYHYVQSASFLTENKAFMKGTPVYKDQLKKIYQSAEKGNVIMLGFGEYPSLSGHEVLVTGAYTNDKGEHMLILYDNNIPTEYGKSDRYRTVITISSDWSEAKYYFDDVDRVIWTDDFSQFKTFDIKGNGLVSAFYQAFFRHLGNVFMMLFDIIRAVFK
ncbi:MAG: hypothetical protein K6F09_04870 [Clostridiales bacterium]|nr:hypothetical protein [Clostridiales bacterium]